MKLPPDTCPIVTHLRGIDLNRHLNLPYGSLTPGCDNPEPRWRIEARQDADETSPLAAWMFLAFLTITAGIIAYYLLTYPTA
jgi:hypothetical protein